MPHDRPWSEEGGSSPSVGVLAEEEWDEEAGDTEPQPENSDDGQCQKQ